MASQTNIMAGAVKMMTCTKGMNIYYFLSFGNQISFVDKFQAYVCVGRYIIL